MSLRKGEDGAIPDRTERYFERDHYWYYTTREGVSIGPFDSKTGAMAGCGQFIDYIAHRNPALAETLEWYGRHAA